MFTFLSINFWLTSDFYFTEKQTLYFLLHYISMKVPVTLYSEAEL